MYFTNISDAKASLSHLIKLIQEKNETVIIGKAGKPVAVLSAYNEDTSPRQLGGSWEGKVVVKEGFDHSIFTFQETTSMCTMLPSPRLTPPW